MRVAFGAQALSGKRVAADRRYRDFIGKVWLAMCCSICPEIGKLYLLIRRQKSNPGRARFEKMVEESPVFDPLFERYGDRLGAYLAASKSKGPAVPACLDPRMNRQAIKSSPLAPAIPQVQRIIVSDIDLSRSFVREPGPSDRSAWSVETSPSTPLPTRSARYAPNRFAIALKQRIEYRGLFHHLLETRRPGFDFCRRISR